MADMGWREAIVRVLHENTGDMHYSAIAQEIIDRKYRLQVGATPANTVASLLSQDPLRNNVIKIERGIYRLKETTQPQLAAETSHPEDFTNMKDLNNTSDAAAEEMGLINAFGIFWHRDETMWSEKPIRLLGEQQSGSAPVDFGEQVGVYLLYDGSRIVYVGRVTEPRMGLRLWEHTRDRHKGRWDRFSWFGVRPVDDNGILAAARSDSIEVNTLIATMEALLIEGLEPPQNRRKGDGFNAVEFIQVIDPKIKLRQQQEMLSKLQHQLFPGN
ncbi:HTH domain-containing protein [Rhodococcus sp. 14-2496-1d]|uniref:HTH domain-containing protein n=1 Tax=Rhodococcus sp. 14-2496-1d TaxID=2023146 RepID=UPI001C52AB64|nr:HTH domain-containing protein [Rhodococcus sp. 14-2496-1d]